MSEYPLLFDSEVAKVRELLMWAILDLHKHVERESFIWFWGKEYRIVVGNGQMTIEPVKK